MPVNFGNRPTVNGVGVALQGEAGGPNLKVLAADVANANATPNTLQDVTGLSFDVVANQVYRFFFWIVFDAAATTTGSRFTLDGPANNLLAYVARIATATGSTGAQNQNAYNAGGPTGSSPYASGNIAEVVGVVRPTAPGTIKLRFASEVASSAITVRAGSSVEWS